MPKSNAIYTGGELIKIIAGGLTEEASKELKSRYYSDALGGIFADAELMNACFCLFANNLNVSRTAGKLYMHRNTLIYSLKKIEKRCGLDLKKFPDAVTFLTLYGVCAREGIK